MQSLKKIHVWAQMQVPLCAFSLSFNVSFHALFIYIGKEAYFPGRIIFSWSVSIYFSLKMEPGIERPQSALARGVQITEFKESHVNPEPIVLEETDLLMEQYLSPRKLVS